MTASSVSRAEIERQLALDEDELSAELAFADPASEGELYSFASARARGQQILEQLSGVLRSRICDDWRYCERRSTEGFRDDATLAVAVADVILGVVGALPVGTIAVLLVKRGLSTLCSCGDG